jgi:hypothetical protein
VGRVTADVFAQVMLTNALAPMHVVEALNGCVKPGGTIGVMTSTQGSVSLCNCRRCVRSSMSPALVYGPRQVRSTVSRSDWRRTTTRAR